MAASLSNYFVYIISLSCILGALDIVQGRIISKLPRYQLESGIPENQLARKDALTSDMFSRGEEPSLFDLLISALGNGESHPESQYPAIRPDMIIGSDGEKRDNYKQAKPCYWSLVSCYKKRNIRSAKRIAAQPFSSVRSARTM